MIITAADTDIKTLAAATAQSPENFPQIRVVNVLQLQQQIAINTYAEEVLVIAKVMIFRLFGKCFGFSFSDRKDKKLLRNWGILNTYSRQ
ncbi:cobalamin biosynthetic protein [Pseudanabaena sp. ABRG5-3]|nr:hypothetical protein [Pseudanabaena sp. ABRG5-3]BBC25354.1 cobalamin biosynthetic protein [Pseudanabaena sp. ABRG5-3]